MAILTQAALDGYRRYTKRTIAYAKYRIGSTWRKTNVTDVKVRDDGIVEIAFKIDASIAGTGTVAEVQLYDTDQNLWADKHEELNMSTVAEGFTYVFEVSIKEATAE